MKMKKENMPKYHQWIPLVAEIKVNCFPCLAYAALYKLWKVYVLSWSVKKKKTEEKHRLATVSYDLLHFRQCLTWNQFTYLTT